MGVAEVISNVQSFEGMWSTPGSDELAIQVILIDDRTGTLLMSQGPGTEETLNIEYIIDGNKLLYNYEDGDQLVTLELVDDNTVNFINYDGYKLELEKVEFTNEEVIVPTPGIYAPLGSGGKLRRISIRMEVYSLS